MLLRQAHPEHPEIAEAGQLVDSGLMLKLLLRTRPDEGLLDAREQLVP